MGSSYHQLIYHYVWIYMRNKLILEIALQGGLFGAAPGFRKTLVRAIGRFQKLWPWKNITF